MAETEEPLSNVSENSFVILGQGSLPSSVNEDHVINEPGVTAKNETSSLKSDGGNSELSQSRYSEANSYYETAAQEKLNQLIQENYHLRETLTQNNLAIKSQLDTFVMWQQEVLKTHESHKEKFLETKEMILKLKAENADLKKQLQENSQGFLNMNGNAHFTNGDAHLMNGDVSDNIEIMREQLKEYKEKFNSLTVENENLNAENYKLKEDLKASENTILKLSKDLEDIGRENKFLKQNSESSRHSLESFSSLSLPNSEARVQIANLSKQLDEEKGKVSKLKEEIQKLQANSSLNESFKANSVTEQSKSNNNTTEPLKPAVIEEIDHYINKLDKMNVSFDLQNQRFNSMVSWVSLAEENLTTMKDNKVEEKVDSSFKSEISQLKSHLNQEVDSFRQKQNSLQDIQGQFKRLLEDYKDLQEKMKILEINTLNVSKYEEEIQKLTEEIKVKDKELASKQQECDQYKEEINKLNLQCEEVALLRVQMQVYQTDFNDEREAREKLATEKEAMAEQIRGLLRKIKILESKNEPTAGGSVGAEEPASDASQSRFVCPKCMFSFQSLGKCQEHVEDCLNEHML